MPAITATFETRRDADMAIEHLVQEHGIDRGAVAIGTADEENSAGESSDGADNATDWEDGDDDGAALNGAIVVTVTVDGEDEAEAVQEVFQEFGGADVSQEDE